MDSKPNKRNILPIRNSKDPGKYLKYKHLRANYIFKIYDQLTCQVAKQIKWQITHTLQIIQKKNLY